MIKINKVTLETTLEAMLFDEEQLGVKETGYRALTDDVPTDVEMEDDPTPRLRKRDSRSPDTEGNETSSDEEPFRTPLTRLRSKRIPSPNSSDLSEGESPVAKKQVGMMKGKVGHVWLFSKSWRWITLVLF
jgi:hypothetical protein